MELSNKLIKIFWILLDLNIRSNTIGLLKKILKYTKHKLKMHGIIEWWVKYPMRN